MHDLLPSIVLIYLILCCSFITLSITLAQHDAHDVEEFHDPAALLLPEQSVPLSCAGVY